MLNRIVPVLVVFSGNNITKQIYEKLRREVNWEHQHPPGLIFHAAAFDEFGNNIHVTNIWETLKDLNDFVSKKLMPIMQDNKIPIPDVEIFHITDISTYPGIDKYKAYSSSL
jgi:hypothetical protein